MANYFTDNEHLTHTTRKGAIMLVLAPNMGLPMPRRRMLEDFTDQ